MNIFSNLIYGYNITVIQLLAPIIGISLMSVFIMIYLLLSIKTKKGIYITISVTLSFILIYNIISLIIIFLCTYGANKINPNLSITLHLANNIIILIAVALMPINSKSFISRNKNLINLNNTIFAIVVVLSIALIIVSIIYPNRFFTATINYYESSENNSYYIKSVGLFYLIKNYIILLVFTIMFISTLADMIINYDYKSNIIMTISVVIALILIVRYLYLEKTIENVGFDRIGFAIVISSSFRSISIFSSFAKNALESIKKESVLNNKLHLNLRTLNNIDRISEQLNIIDKNLMDTSMFVFEIDKEAKDAYNIISSKIDSILDANDRLMEAKNSKKNIIKDGLKYTNTIFTFFDKISYIWIQHEAAL